MAGCAPFKEGEKSASNGDEKPTPVEGEKTARDRLRDCWLRLDWLAEQAQQGREQGEKAQKELNTEYHAALGSLIASGELDEEVAHHIRYAFAAAAGYVVGSHSRETIVTQVAMCYEIFITPLPATPPTATPVPPPTRTPRPTPTPTPKPTPTAKQAFEERVADYSGNSAARLAQQADLLAEMAGQSEIDAGTVERAQRAIERDLFLLSSTPAEREALARRLVEMAGGTYNLPPFEQWDPALPPDVAEAARFLVELLLGKE